MKQTLLNNLKSVQASLANGIATRWTLDYHCKNDLTQISHLFADTLGEIESEESAQPSKAMEALNKANIELEKIAYEIDEPPFYEDTRIMNIMSYFSFIRSALIQAEQDRAESEHAELEAMEAFERLLNTPDYELEPIVEGMNEYDVETVRSALIQAEQDRAELATLREQFRTPTADEVCEAISKVFKPCKVIYKEETNLFVNANNGNVLADESQTDAFLKIALFYKAQEENK